MTLSVQGAGGKFMGGAGGGSLGIGEDVTITINLMSVFDDSGINEAKAAVNDTAASLGNLAGATSTVLEANETKTKSVKDQTTAHKEGKTANDLAAESIRESIAPIRSVSWDLMLMGRSLSILNTIWGNHNVILKEITGVVYGVGAVMRIAVTAADLMRVGLEFGLIPATWMQIGANTALGTSNIALAGTFSAVAVAAKAAMISIGPIGWAMIGAGALLALAIGVKGSFQGGGTVSETGAYMLHKGETVIPAGTSMNIININMNSGPISSSVDVDHMLDNMALRMTQESRRRRGR